MKAITQEKIKAENKLQIPEIQLPLATREGCYHSLAWQKQAHGNSQGEPTETETWTRAVTKDGAGPKASGVSS